jgi:hypothetical protein
MNFYKTNTIGVGSHQVAMSSVNIREDTVENRFKRFVTCIVYGVRVLFFHHRKAPSAPTTGMLINVQITRQT